MTKPCTNRQPFFWKFDKVCIKFKHHRGPCHYTVAWADHINTIALIFVIVCLTIAATL